MNWSLKMDHTDSDKPAPRYYIAYGWSEGTWQSRKMRELLGNHGFKATEDALEADIIIAHSLGCYLIPPNRKAKLIVLIGLPYWPGRPAIVSVLKTTADNLKSSWHGGSSWWLKKLVFNVWYILVRPSDSYHAVTRRRLSFLPKSGATEQILLVRNAGDQFCRADIRRLLPKTLGYEYVDMDRELHEDCWLNPAAYVKLIEKNYG